MERPGEDTPRREPVIEARALVRRFGAVTAVDGFDLEVYRGEVFGFLGPNGAGKSTAIRLLLGLLAPSAGSARVLGLRVPEDAEALRPRVGYMTQHFSLYEDLSVAENLDFAAEVFGLERARRRQRIAAVMAEYGLAERREQRPATLSGGWRQRLALAAATVHEPELLFLDEPTAGVDPESRRLFWDQLFALAARGTTILVSTHYMDEALRCHRLCVVRAGRRAALGRPDDLTRALDRRAVEVWGEPLAAVLRELRARPEVASATQLGHRVHALLARGAPPRETALPALLAQLTAAGVRAVEGAAGEADLEDVVVAATLGEELAGGEAAR